MSTSTEETNNDQVTETSSQETTSTENSTATTDTTTEETTNSAPQDSAGQSSEGNPIADALKESDGQEPPKTEGSGEGDPEGNSEDSQEGDGATSEPYEISVDDDSMLTDEDLDEIARLAEEGNWTKERAEAAIAEREGYYSKGAEIANRPRVEYYNEQVAHFNKDPDFNGDKKKETYASISRAVQTFGDKDMIEQLSRPEIGHNYQLAKFLKRIGDEVFRVQQGGDPTILLGKGSGGGGKTLTDDEQMLRNLYPDMFNEEKSS